MITPITQRDPRKLYLERFVFMAALLIPAVFRGGFRPLMVCAVCVICCMFTDWVCCRIRRVKYDIKDPAVWFWGLSCAMLMPAGIPHVIAGAASVICIVLGKHIFGGNENLVFFVVYHRQRFDSDRTFDKLFLVCFRFEVHRVVFFGRVF